MRITKICVEELFGIYNYSIPLDNGNNITIIHGPNGCGKTTILRMLDALFNKKISYFSKVAFKSFSIYFDQQIQLNVLKRQLKESIENNEMEDGQQFYIYYEIISNGETIEYDPLLKGSINVDRLIRKELRGRANRLIPFLEQISLDTWMDLRTKERLSTEAVVDKFGEAILPRLLQRNYFNVLIPNEVLNLISEIDLQMISADRLTVRKIEKSAGSFGENTQRIEQKVNIYAKDISAKIKDAIQEYAVLSQSLDRTFPVRVIKAEDSLELSEIKSIIIQLEEERERLVETGILEPEQEALNIRDLIDSIVENNRQTLSLYIKDTEKKLGILSSLSASINLFRNLIEKKYTNKNILFDKEFGFKFVTNYSDKKIDASSLSSGEQQELVMLYDLVFNTSANTLILIDEPELSLHIKWQLEYLDDLLMTIRNSKFSALIATHSPQIIHDRWDLTVSLVGEND